MIAAKDETLEPVKPVRTDDRDLFVKINTFECYLGRITPEACKLQRERKAPDGTINSPIPCRTCTDWEKKAQEVYRKRLEYLREQDSSDKRLEHLREQASSGRSSPEVPGAKLNFEVFSKKIEEVNETLKNVIVRIEKIDEKLKDFFEDSEGKGPLAEVLQTYASIAVEEVVSEINSRLFELEKELISVIEKVKEELLERLNKLSVLKEERTSTDAETETSKDEKTKPPFEKQTALLTTEKAKRESSQEKAVSSTEESKKSVLKVTSKTGKTVYKFAKCVSCGKEGKILARDLCIRCYFIQRKPQKRKNSR